MATVRRWLLGLVLLVPITGAVSTAISVAAPTATVGAAQAKSCGYVTVKGHKYGVSATNVKCSFAIKWVRVMAAKKVKGSRAELSKGPGGYACIGGSTSAGNGVQVSGNCSKGIGLGNSPYFNWSTYLGSS